MRSGTIHVSYLDPFNEKQLVQALATRGVTALSMEMIPRTTLAQKMDALSSQASLGGYAAVILAASRLTKIFPMMMTPAGTIQAARIFIIGAGVAGLQAIATAKRLGARVEAFDTRPVVAEQVKSLGARFVEVDLGETGQTRDGYARELSPVQLQKQREAMARVCAQADVVITTAQVFGRKAPLIITREMIAGMKPGSLVIDMAVESGGNVEGSVRGREIMVNGVNIIGLENLPGRVVRNASQMYSANLTSLVEHFWSSASSRFELNLDDEILKGCLVTHDNEILNEALKKHYGITTSPRQ
jgi:NAD(P) transhydrogenase subunit alpha